MVLTKRTRAPICEIFQSIQGEGPNIGRKTIFIRFWGCNLRCRFDGKCCDTPYSVITKKGTKMYTPNKLIENIKSYNTNLITITGGEPMLYQKFIEDFMRKLSVAGWKGEVEIETNGTIVPISYLYINCKFNISAKLKSSNQETKTYDERRINFDTLNTYPIQRSSYKFVYVDREDIYEIKTILANTKIKEVYLMPQGTTRKEIVKNSQKVVDICIENNWNFSPREHIIIWNNKKGV